MENTRKKALLAGECSYFTGNPCIKGHIAARRAKTGECLECRTVAVKVWRKNNPDKAKQHNLTQYLNHPQKIKDNVKNWSKKNPVKVLSYTRATQAKRMLRLPKWLTEDDKWMIEEAYHLAALRTKVMGFPWHVDHIIPLQGKTVSGLHVPSNLQVIPALENVLKSNKYEVAL